MDTGWITLTSLKSGIGGWSVRTVENLSSADGAKNYADNFTGSNAVNKMGALFLGGSMGTGVDISSSNIDITETRYYDRVAPSSIFLAENNWFTLFGKAGTTWCSGAYEYGTFGTSGVPTQIPSGAELTQIDFKVTMSASTYYGDQYHSILYVDYFGVKAYYEMPGGLFFCMG